MRTTRITIARLFNLGSYEHCRYEISVEIAEGESAKSAIIGLEKVMAALAPESKCSVRTRGELDRELNCVLELRNQLSLPEDEFRRRHGHFEGTPKEYYERCEKMHAENVARREAYEKRAARARELLDELGGAEHWKDAKLDWENDYFGDE